MKEILTAHASILQKIPQMISEQYHVRTDKIKLVNVSSMDEAIMSFQLVFTPPESEEICLNFELREAAPHMLFFEPLTGLKGYEKSLAYGSLGKDIFKYIDLQIEA